MKREFCDRCAKESPTTVRRGIALAEDLCGSQTKVFPLTDVYDLCDECNQELREQIKKGYELWMKDAPKRPPTLAIVKTEEEMGDILASLFRSGKTS